MGFSGMLGTVKVLGQHCPVVGPDGVVTAPTSGFVRWTDEITKFTITDEVFVREYGHDKSNGFQDAVSGTLRLEITLDAVCHSQLSSDSAIGVGQVVWLQLWPFGDVCGTTPVEGYAMVRRRTITTDLEQGRPVEYTMTLVSHYQWFGLPGYARAAANSITTRGGFECNCLGGHAQTADNIGSNDTEY